MKLKVFKPIVAVALLAVAVVSHHAAAQEAARRVEIVAQRFEFSPSEITLKKGVPVVLVLTSKDVEHGLKFKELDLNIKAKKGAITEVSLTPQKTGTFVGQCSVFCGSGHGAMKLTLHVVE